MADEQETGETPVIISELNQERRTGHRTPARPGQPGEAGEGRQDPAPDRPPAKMPYPRDSDGPLEPSS